MRPSADNPPPPAAPVRTLSALFAVLATLAPTACTTHETVKEFAAAELALATGRYDEALEHYTAVEQPELADAVAEGMRTARALRDLNAAARALRDGDTARAVNLFCRPEWSRVPRYKIPPTEVETLESIRRKLVVALEERLSSDPILLEHPSVLLPAGLQLEELGILPQGLERTIRHYRAWGFRRRGDIAAAWCETALLRSIGGVYEADRLRDELEPLLGSVLDDLPRESVRRLDYTIEVDGYTLGPDGALEVDYTLLTPERSWVPPVFCVVSREPPGFRQVAVLQNDPAAEPLEIDTSDEYAPVYRLKLTSRGDLSSCLDHELYLALRNYGGQRAFKKLTQLLDSFLPLLRLNGAGD
ncbi:MAG: hypothetical protein GF399_12980 [Candidatus Coatesbacteria bacterium]|nr:hypothetical protein [Candidatus Coatesbacteria bacterium]